VTASAAWPALGTTAAVVVTNAGALAAAREAVTAELDAIDRACSRFRDDSELTRLNLAGGRPTRVGAVLMEAVELALRAAALTDGAVDPTVGRALELAGYDRDFAAVAPRPGALRAVKVAGWRSVVVDPRGGWITVPAGVRLDLGATAKALAADRGAAAAACAVPRGTGVLVNLGGDIAVAGPSPGQGWVVRVAEDHRARADAEGQTITIHSGGLATSSTTVRRWGDAHHIIDPRTGRPARVHWRTVSVAAGSCADANIASTAAIVSGPDAIRWLEAMGMPARLVDASGAVLAVGGWPSEALAA
jgi:thiamine biosynthesis lipoprotein